MCSLNLDSLLFVIIISKERRGDCQFNCLYSIQYNKYKKK